MAGKWSKRYFENSTTYTPPGPDGKVVEYVVYSGYGGPHPFHVSWARPGYTTLHRLKNVATMKEAFAFIRSFHAKAKESTWGL